MRTKGNPAPSGPVKDGMLSAHEVTVGFLKINAQMIEWARGESLKSHLDFRTRPSIINDCAETLVMTWELGDADLAKRAEQNLRDAVALPWSMCARLGPERCWCGRRGG